MSAPDSVTITVRDTDRDEDSDGVRDTVENGAPNNGDGNNDGILDSLQPHVTSLPNTGNQGYITLVSPQGTALADVRFLRNPPAGAPTDLRFPWGFLVFTVLDVPPGERVTVTLLPPPNTALAADAFYFKFGPTPETPGDHFYTFTFDGTTGAEILPDRIQLHLVDGARGITISRPMAGLLTRALWPLQRHHCPMLRRTAAVAVGAASSSAASTPTAGLEMRWGISCSRCSPCSSCMAGGGSPLGLLSNAFSAPLPGANLRELMTRACAAHDIFLTKEADND